MGDGVREWLVAADDRTGAFEVAALFAQVVGPVTVTVGAAPDGSGVVDLGSRALVATEAARVAAAIDATPSTWVAHKMDSTLRGNWAAELRSRQRATRRRVVVLPGWPELGRTCVGGVVLVNGVAVGNVLEHLADADSLADAAAVHRWLEGDAAIAICDIPDTEAMHVAAQVLAGHDVLIAGPAGPLGAVFAASHRASTSASPAAIAGPVLVVCGSANPVAHDQLNRLRAARPDVEVVATDVPDGDLHARAVEALTVRARPLMEQSRTVVIIGGDTVAALLGDTLRLIDGFAAAGMPFIRPQRDGPLVITKAGGFGGPNALVDLLGGENG
ncbi:MAG: hypothetical protein K8R99_04175 [Actinomycetia bacterium]|nr:hypothetical protein [Actinomycetes bacterium]